MYSNVMYSKAKCSKLGFIIIACLISMSAFADGVLDTSSSALQFISVKKSSVAEIHTVEFSSGKISKDGVVNLNLNLSSVESLIPIRNERMKEFLFEVAKHPLATISAKVDLKSYENMPVGVTASEKLTVTVNMHGQEKALSTEVNITKLVDNKIVVNSSVPLIVNASDFALVSGVEKLASLAALPSISTAVPVTFSLVFNL